MCLAGDTVRLLSGEREPYIGSKLDNYGYVYEVVQEAFRREGYKVEVTFYPWARANHLALSGLYDGIMPVHQDSLPQLLFTLSDPFPGDVIGLLVRKHKHASDDRLAIIPNNRTALLNSLKDKTIGVVRGSHLLNALQQGENLRIHEGNQELNNLNMLNDGRLDVVLTDKYTAAKTMIDNRPQFIGHMAFMQPPLAEDPFHIAFNNSSGRAEQLTRVFNRGLSAMKQDNSLQQFLARHGLLESDNQTDGQEKLTIATVNNPDMAIMHALSSRFEQLHPDIHIEWMNMDEEVLRRRLLSDLALDDGQFDIMMIGNYEVPIWASKGWLHRLERLPDDYHLSDIFPRVRQALSYQRGLYALPFYAESVMTYYRRDVFEQAGLKMPVQPTYQQIKRFAKAIHNPQQGIYGICLRGKPGWGENMGVITSMVSAYGGKWFDADWQAQLTGTSWQQAVSDYRELLLNYGPPAPWKYGYTESLGLFANGQCGIWIDATVAAGQLFNPEFSQVAEQVDIAPAPVARASMDWLWVWALAIPQSSRHKEMAEEFITWATSAQYIGQVAGEYGWVSVPPGTRLSTYQTEEYIRVAPFASLVQSAMQTQTSHDAGLPYTGFQFVSIPEFVAIGGTTGQYMAEMLKGNLTVKETLEAAQQFTEKQMRLSGYTD